MSAVSELRDLAAKLLTIADQLEKGNLTAEDADLEIQSVYEALGDVYV